MEEQFDKEIHALAQQIKGMHDQNDRMAYHGVSKGV